MVHKTRESIDKQQEALTAMTVEAFDKIPAGEVFATGVLPNSSEGIFMTRGGGNMRWVAKKGYANDWVVYCHWDHMTEEFITSNGDKIHAEEYIKRCVPCTDEVYHKYRH